MNKQIYTSIPHFNSLLMFKLKTCTIFCGMYSYIWYLCRDIQIEVTTVLAYCVFPRVLYQTYQQEALAQFCKVLIHNHLKPIFQLQEFHQHLHWLHNWRTIDFPARKTKFTRETVVKHAAPRRTTDWCTLYDRLYTLYNKVSCFWLTND